MISDPNYQWWSEYAGCRNCGDDNLAIQYMTATHGKCHDCMGFYLIERSKHLCSFTLEEFKDWKNQYGRRCTYCGIDAGQLWRMNAAAINGGRLESIGVDRVDNERGYDLDNIVACCGPCNRIKANFFTFEEMRKIGLALQPIWRQRLEDEEIKEREREMALERAHQAAINNPPPPVVIEKTSRDIAREQREWLRERRARQAAAEL